LTYSNRNKPGAIIIEGHVQGLSNTRALGEAGIPVIVVDKNNCIARYSKYCKKFYKSPDFASDELADFLVDLAINRDLTGWLLLPSNDHAVLTLSRNKVRLEEYYKVITPGLDIIENIYDKARLLNIAERVGVSIPNTYYPHNDNIGETGLVFPVLTKGRYGLDFYRSTGRKAFLANDQEELRKQLTQIKQTIPVEKVFTQELIPDNGTNKTISFAAFCDKGEILSYWMGEKIREHPARFGTATCAKSVYVEECYKQSVPLLKELNYTGVCEVEYLLDPRDQQYKLIEINARTWLWVELARHCGVDFAKIVYSFVNHINLHQPKGYSADGKWVNVYTDIAYSLKEILNGRLSLRNYRHSFIGSTKIAMWNSNDLLPFFVYPLMAFSFLKRR